MKRDRESALKSSENKAEQLSLSQEELKTSEWTHPIIRWHSCRTFCLGDVATGLLRTKIPVSTCWANGLLEPKIRRSKSSPTANSFCLAWSATVQQAWHGAKSPLANETRSFWRATRDPELGEFPKQKPAREFNNSLPRHHMLNNIVLLQCWGLSSVSRVLHSCHPGAVLSLFPLFYYFSGNSNQCNRAPRTRWRMVSPSPSSFSLMNCLFSYQRVMSSKPHNIYSWNKRQEWSWVWGGGEQFLGMERKKSWTF